MEWSKSTLTFCLMAVVAFLSTQAIAQGDPRVRAAPSISVESSLLPPPAPSREDAVLEAFVDGVVAAHRREHNIPGVTVSVVRNGRLLFAKGYGVADIETGTPVDGETTLFRIGSVSKTFVWTAVMRLVEQGRLDLDADVNDYLTAFKIPDAFDTPVTMNDLMTHRGGFENTWGVFTHGDDSEITLAEALERDMPSRVFAPGARTSYSNWGTALATHIVENVSGRSYDAILRDDLLAPLGMQDATQMAPSKLTGRLKEAYASGHKLEQGAPSIQDKMQLGPYASVGGIAAAADDMGLWMLMHLGGGAFGDVRLMQPATHQTMWTRHFTDRPLSDDLAHGFFSKIYGDTLTLGHGGGMAGFLTNMVMAPELNLGIFISQNTATTRELVNRLPFLVIDHVRGEARVKIEAPSTDALALSDYQGQFLNNRRSFTRFEKLFATNGIMAVSQYEGSLVLTDVNGSVRYHPMGTPDVFENSNGDRVLFGRDANGVVSHITTNVHSFDRVTATTNPLLLNLGIGLALLFSMTTWLGAWRRQAVKDIKQSKIGARLGQFDLVAAGSVLVMIVMIVLITVALASASASMLVDYPPLTVTLFRGAAHLAFLAGVFAVVSIVPAWLMSGWSIWRKGHHTLFALALGVMAFTLLAWRVVFSSTI